MLDKNLQKNNLKHFFESRIFSRGVTYYNANLVASLKAFPDKDPAKIKIKGEVAGSDYYHTSMTFDLRIDKFSGLDCDCPYDDNCKHLVALGLEFIDLLQEFASSHNCDFNSADLRAALIGWVNKQKLARNYQKFKEDSGEDGREDEITEGAIEEIGKEAGNRFHDMTRKELVNHLKTSLSMGDAPLEAINGIINELSLRAAADDAGTANYEQSRITPLPLPYPDHNKAYPQQAGEFNPGKFFIVIEYDYNFDVHVHKSKGETINPEQILKKYSEMTENQKKLFEYLKKLHASWQFRGNIDYGELFGLIKNSGMKIFKKKGSYQWNTRFEKLFFAAEPEKIKAELILRKHCNQYYDHTRYDFFFKLSGIYEIKRYEQSSRLFCGSEHLIHIDGNKVHFHEVPSHLARLVSRVDLRRSNYYGRGDEFLQTKLAEDEIVGLNRIIGDGKKFLDLKTDLEADYDIRGFNKSAPLLAVDFCAEETSLDIKAMIDYGFFRQDVSETVYFARGKNSRGFKRREYKNQGKYAMEINDKDISYAPLAVEKEINLFKSYYDNAGFSKTLICRHSGEKQIFDFFRNNWPEIIKVADKNGYEIEFIRDKFNFAEENFRADFNIDLNAENDWLWFDVNCYCGNDKIGLEDLRQYVENGKEFIKMENGRLLKIANFEELERFILMLESFYARENGFEGRLYHAPELENIFTGSKYYNAKVKNSFNKFIKEAKRGKPVEKIKLKPAFNKIMRPYQKEGVYWLYFLRKYRFAGILADDMGLGKTLQTLAILEMEKKENKPSIVICPKSILYNWESEAKKFVPDLKTAVIDGLPAERKAAIKKAKKCDLIITGYATMKRDAEIYEKEKIKFNYCVLDEAQFIKNHATKNARIVKKINADFRLALTGTPLENSVSEIWSVFDFLMPGFLGSYGAFVKKFQNPIMKQNNAVAMEHLREKIKCFMLRRTKGEVLKELPPKVEQTAHCRLEKAQNILYQEILSSVKAEIFTAVQKKGFNKSRIHILAGLTKLRQVCNHPALLLKNKNYAKYESAKLEMFAELLDEIVGNKRKVLVFSQFTQMLDILAAELKKNKISFNYLSGKTKNRQELVDDFNNSGDKRVFLISLKAGGTGLNLTSADNVIIFDPWWNPSVENQAVDRAHRIGQTKSVNVYRLITLGTIEEKIVKLQEKKKFLFDNLVGESGKIFQKLTWDDIKELFK